MNGGKKQYSHCNVCLECTCTPPPPPPLPCSFADGLIAVHATLSRGVQALPVGLRHPDPHRPLPQHLRALRYLEGEVSSACLPVPPPPLMPDSFTPVAAVSMQVVAAPAVATLNELISSHMIPLNTFTLRSIHLPPLDAPGLNTPLAFMHRALL